MIPIPFFFAKALREWVSKEQFVSEQYGETAKFMALTGVAVSSPLLVALDGAITCAKHYSPIQR